MHIFFDHDLRHLLTIVRIIDYRLQTTSVLLFAVLARSTCASGRLGTVDQYLLGPTESDDQSDGPTTAQPEGDHTTTTIDYALDYGDSSEIPLVLHDLTVHIDSFAEDVGNTEDQYV